MLWTSMGRPHYPLEPSPEGMRALAAAAADFLARFVDGQPDAAASDLDGALDIARRFRGPLPPTGSSFEDLLARLGDGAAKAFNTTGPGYLAFIPGGGIYAAALADYLADGTNRFVNVWNAAPAFAQIEATVIRWLGDLFSMPDGGGGILSSGGSMANF